MSKVVTAEVYTVEVIGKAKESSYEQGKFYYPTLFRLEGSQGDDGKVWKNLSDAEISQITRGDRIQLVETGKDKSGKPKHNIVLLNSSPGPIASKQTVATEQGLSPEQKRAIATHITEQAKLFKFCFETVSQNIEGLSEDSQRAIATTLYIQTGKKFNL
jgi:hypothetical protein